MIANNLKVQEVIWFTNMQLTGGLVGIVVTKDTISGETKMFIGTGMGFDEERDTEDIIEMGSKFHPDQLKILMGYLK